MSNGTFLFASSIALYPPLRRSAEIVAREHDLEGHLLAPLEFAVPAIHKEDAVYRATDFDPASTTLRAHFLPARRGDVLRFGFEPRPLRRLLGELDPDYVWVHGEFWQGIAHQFLWHWRLRRQPRIVARGGPNHLHDGVPLLAPRPPFVSRTRLKRMLLWGRLDGVGVASSLSGACARRIGLPGRIPVAVNYLPACGPADAAAEGVELPWPAEESFVVGFAGALTAQKGWPVLLDAVEALPRRFKLFVAGAGPQEAELRARLASRSLSGRSLFAGVVPTGVLLATYPRLDAVVLPSITTANSVEIFGRVLAEAMACGVPVVGSDSGAIPETIGDAGLVVPEGDAEALRCAILRLSTDEQLRAECIRRGKERYERHYTCEAYAASIAALLGIDR